MIKVILAIHGQEYVDILHFGRKPIRTEITHSEDNVEYRDMTTEELKHYFIKLVNGNDFIELDNYSGGVYHTKYVNPKYIESFYFVEETGVGNNE